MDLVVTSTGGAEEEFDGLPSLLFFSWVIIGSAGFLLGWFAARLYTQVLLWWASPPRPGRWETLVHKALFFVGRRRRVSLVNAYRNSTLRNTPVAKPNAARRTLRARAHTPRPPTSPGSPLVLNEGPAIQRHNGSHGR